jgi:hypothetical protein
MKGKGFSGLRWQDRSSIGKPEWGLGWTEARIGKEDDGKERVRGPRVTRAAVGHPERVWLKVYSKWISFNKVLFSSAEVSWR